MLAASQGQCSTHGFNQIHTLGKDTEGETETERNGERERAKEKKGEIVKQRGADIKTELFFALLWGEFTLYDWWILWKMFQKITSSFLFDPFTSCLSVTEC